MTIRSLCIWSILTVATCVVFTGPASAAGEDDAKFEIGVLSDLLVLDKDISGSDNPSLQPSVGVRAAGSLPWTRWGWFTDALYYTTDTDTFRRDTRSISARAGLERMIIERETHDWFVTFGLGYLDLTFDNALDFSSMFASAGIGQEYPVLGGKYVRWELRSDFSLAKDGLVDAGGRLGADITNTQLLIGLSWRPGARKHTPPPVPDPGPPPAGTADSVTMTASPFASDDDGDGVLDPLDRCPDTIQGIEVDAAGCPRDDDGDGVHDGLGMDKCLGTPRGAMVDVHGCPLDSDGDGIFDGLDRCPETPPSSTVGLDGCRR